MLGTRKIQLNQLNSDPISGSTYYPGKTERCKQRLTFNTWYHRTQICPSSRKKRLLVGLPWSVRASEDVVFRLKLKRWEGPIHRWKLRYRLERHTGLKSHVLRNGSDFMPLVYVEEISRGQGVRWSEAWLWLDSSHLVM